MNRYRWAAVITSLLALPLVAASVWAQNPGTRSTTSPGANWTIGADTPTESVSGWFTAQQSSTAPQTIVNITYVHENSHRVVNFGASAQIVCGGHWFTLTKYATGPITLKQSCSGLGPASTWAGTISIND
jgi:hypothetical protein